MNNRSNAQTRFGFTEPISLGGPSDYDVVKTRELEKVWFIIYAFSGVRHFVSSFMLNLDCGVSVFARRWIV